MENNGGPRSCCVKIRTSFSRLKNSNILIRMALHELASRKQLCSSLRKQFVSGRESFDENHLIDKYRIEKQRLETNYQKQELVGALSTTNTIRIPNNQELRPSRVKIYLYNKYPRYFSHQSCGLMLKRSIVKAEIWQLSRGSTMLVSEFWFDKVQNPKRTWVISRENAV